MNFSCWKCADDGCLGTVVSLLIGLLYASLQIPLDNRENKNSRNVCLSEICKNIFLRKFLLIQSKKFQITYKIIVCGEKSGQNWYFTCIIQKIIKDPSCLAMCNVYFRNELPTVLPVHLMPFSIRMTSCQYKLAVIFMCRLCIHIAIWAIDMLYCSVNILTIDTFDNQ